MSWVPSWCTGCLEFPLYLASVVPCIILQQPLSVFHTLNFDPSSPSSSRSTPFTEYYSIFPEGLFFSPQARFMCPPAPFSRGIGVRHPYPSYSDEGPFHTGSSEKFFPYRMFSIFLVFQVGGRHLCLVRTFCFPWSPSLPQCLRFG